jgi:hypothetical protein
MATAFPAVRRAPFRGRELHSKVISARSYRHLLVLDEASPMLAMTTEE